MTTLEKNKITNMLNYIFVNRFEINLFDEKLNICLEDNVFGEKLKLKARDLIYLVSDLERMFKIKISDEDIDNIKLNTIGNILTVINKELSVDGVAL